MFVFIYSLPPLLLLLEIDLIWAGECGIERLPRGNQTKRGRVAVVHTPLLDGGSDGGGGEPAGGGGEESTR